MRFRRIRLTLAIVLVGGLFAAGCTRRFYRQQADHQVEEILTEKDRDPWKIENWYVYPDPAARFGDPSNPDKPPMPFDDPAARDLSPNPQKPGKEGVGDHEGTGYLDLIRDWDAINRQGSAGEVPPATSSALPPAIKLPGSEIQTLRTTVTPYILTYDQAIELALLNSREFQDRREDLYLAALVVTLQRFSFAAQFFAGETFFREYTGSQRPDASNQWGMAGTGSVSKLFPTGALLLAQFASRLVFEMSAGAPKRVTVPTSASLDLTQPLLRGGGRAVTLEPLTQSERNLLYSLRAFARFRKQFHVDIAAGGELVSSFPGGGFTFQALTPTGQAPSQGYLPTLLSAALLTNRQVNVSELERIITFYHQLQGGGDVSPLQTAQVESQLLSGRIQALQQELDLRDSLDRFKLQLGVPTDMPLELDDGPIRPITLHLRRLQSVFEQDRAVQRELGPLLNLSADQVRAAFRSRLTGLPLVQGTEFARIVPGRWAELEKLSAAALTTRIRQLADERRVLDDRQLQVESAGKELPPADAQRLASLTFELDLALFEEALRSYETKPWERVYQELPEAERIRRQTGFRQEIFRRLFDLFVRLLGTAREQRLEQVRLNWPAPPRACVEGVDLVTADLDVAQTAAARAALMNRLDLMNARAQLVDGWRQIAVEANALFGVADVQYHLDTANPLLSSNPFGFHAGLTRQQLSLNTELPLTRRLERNNYRLALIAYQRRRRALQAAEDTVLLEARSDVRALRVQAQNYKIQQRAVPVAYSQRDNALETLRLPSPPGTTSSAASAAALTQQLLSAQNTVLQAENQLYQFYVNYLITRLLLYRDLELMPLDPRGVWMDEHATRDCESCGPSGVAAGPVNQPERHEQLPEPRTVVPAPTEEKK